MSCYIALVGNPNCGKTTLFNDLTGSSQHVGNWPGVTVEKKEGTLRKDKEIKIQDLPGIYSLSPYTLEEVVARDYLLKDKPQGLINIVDASNLERNLYLTTQLVELGLPMVVCLNMMDIVEKNGDKINLKELEKRLGCPVISMSAIKGTGSDELVDVLKKMKNHGIKAPAVLPFEEEVEDAIQKVEAITNIASRFTNVKLLEKDDKLMETISASQKQEIEAIVEHTESAMYDDIKSIMAGARYSVVADIIDHCLKKNTQNTMKTSDKIDHWVTNRFLALPIFALVMVAVYYLSITTVGTMLTDWVNDVLFGEIIPPAIESFLVSLGTADWLQGLVLDGIVAGVGAVLGFLPQMAVLFLLLAILEDCGYMARIAFILDRIFRKFGLSGKSFIPMLIGTGCGVPGVMASRTIENENDRRMTIMLTTFIPCSAKLPIIALIAGALFDGAWWVGPSAYFIGFAAIVVSGIILKKTKLFAGDVSPFIMELPAYHLPRVKNVLLQTWERCKHFIVKAGTIIFVSTIVIWFLQSFNWSFEMVDANESILASLGQIIAPIFAPLGWGDWKAAVASVTGLVAKENIIATFGVLYQFAGEVSEDGAEIWGTLAQDFTTISAYAFLIFNLLCAPCFAAIGAIRNEMASGKWTLIAIGYQCLFAYLVAFVFYQLGSLIVFGDFTMMTALAFVVLAIGLFLLFRPAKKVKAAE